MRDKWTQAGGGKKKQGFIENRFEGINSQEYQNFGKGWGGE